jgi:hypothetical protein
MGSNYIKKEGSDMKRYFAILAVGAVATFACVPNASAFPGERVPYRAAHFAGRVVQKIDSHVIHPVTHGVARRLR